MFPIQSLGVECKVCLSHAGGSKVTKPIFSNSIKRYSVIIFFMCWCLNVHRNFS